MLEGDVIMTPSSPTPRPDGISHEIKQTAAITYRTLSQGTGEELGMNTYYWMGCIEAGAPRTSGIASLSLIIDLF